MKTDNQIIAEFMGLRVSPVGRTQYDENGRAYKHEEDLDYDCSWNDLMPVVEKIEDVEVLRNKVKRAAANVQIFYKACFIEYSPDEDSGDENGEFQIQTKGETKLEAVYKAVVAFIKWYNSNKWS